MTGMKNNREKYILAISAGMFLAIWGITGIKNVQIKQTVTTTPKIAPVKQIWLSPTPTIKPTPKSVGTAEWQKKYGPCLKVNVLMYHHVEELADAARKNQTNLAVSPGWFRKQMEYLKVKGYKIIGPDELVAAFNGDEKLPVKTAMITLDDAYEDNFINAYPILKEYGFKATIFIPTGLVTVQDHLNWDQIMEMSRSGLIYFGNHTWSHHSSGGTLDVEKREIGIADNQLAEKDLNRSKIFAYPYGNSSMNAERVLTDLNYNLAFTTVHGNFLCKGQRLILPRVRVGNAQLNSFGVY